MLITFRFYCITIKSGVCLKNCGTLLKADFNLTIPVYLVLNFRILTLKTNDIQAFLIFGDFCYPIFMFDNVVNSAMAFVKKYASFLRICKP